MTIEPLDPEIQLFIMSLLFLGIAISWGWLYSNILPDGSGLKRWP